MKFSSRAYSYRALLCFGVILLQSTFALALGGGGHDVPTPFEFVNSKFELADGEIYQLAGRIVSETEWTSYDRAAQAYLEVDLNYTPWLASAKRISFPYYPLNAGYPWESLEGRKVVLLVRAHGKAVVNRDRTVSYQLSLGLLHRMR